ncbi:hypothetical protein ACTQ4F_02820 [Streptococcus alactolyticus]|uniref:hypothetical protein n=1 Tax=Streptococcus alactolyticus TaxID=29389 RepID=UPI003F98278A
MHVLEAKNREMQMFSFSEDNSEERLMSECSGLSSEIEDESLLRIIMDEAIGKLTVRNQFIIRTIFYEEYTAADLARKEGSCQRQIRRERDRALEQLQLVLGDMGITRLEDLY